MAGFFFVRIVNEVKYWLRSNKVATIVKKWEVAGKPIPAPPQVKRKIIESYKSLSGIDTFIETGTFKGETVEAHRKNFSHIYSIELAPKLFQDAAKRFAPYPHITILQGDSGKILDQITSKLTVPAIFWLDGHYSAGETAKGDKECPIFEEIDAIFRYKKLNHILLVDDARCFIGQGDYPTIDQLTSYVRNIEPDYQVEVKDDIIRYTIQKG